MGCTSQIPKPNPSPSCPLAVCLSATSPWFLESHPARQLGAWPRKGTQGDCARRVVYSSSCFQKFRNGDLILLKRRKMIQNFVFDSLNPFLAGAGRCCLSCKHCCDGDVGHMRMGGTGQSVGSHCCSLGVGCCLESWTKTELGGINCGMLCILLGKPFLGLR